MSAPAWTTVLALIALVLLGVLWRALQERESGRRFTGALGFLALAATFAAVLPWGPEPMRTALRAAMLVALCFGVVRTSVVSVDVLARRRRAHFSTIFLDLITLALYAVVVLAIAGGILGIEVTPLLATSALITAVIGLALQETLGNVFSGLSLQMQKPFEPGDWIRFGNYLGRVQGIGWRSTRLLTRSLELLEVPNTTLAKDVIVNYRGHAVGDELFVGVDYSVPPNRVKTIILDVLANVDAIATVPQPQVLLVDYGDFAIRYRIRFWMIDYARQDEVRDALMSRVWYAFKRHGVHIPFPVREYVQHVEPPMRDETALTAERIAALRQVDFLSDLDDDELTVLSAGLSTVHFGQGEVVCREGEAGHTFYVLVEGRVEVVARAAHDEDTHVADLEAPAFFGEMSLLTGETRSATVRATTDVELLVVGRDGFQRLFQSRPNVAAAISRALAERQTELRDRRDQVPQAVDSRSRRLLARMQAILRF